MVTFDLKLYMIKLYMVTCNSSGSESAESKVTHVCVLSELGNSSTPNPSW